MATESTCTGLLIDGELVGGSVVSQTVTDDPINCFQDFKRINVFDGVNVGCRRTGFEGSLALCSGIGTNTEIGGQRLLGNGLTTDGKLFFTCPPGANAISQYNPQQIQQSLETCNSQTEFNGAFLY